MNKKILLTSAVAIAVVAVASTVLFYTAKTKTSSTVAAVVNNKKIYMDDVKEFYENDPELSSFPMETFYKKILDTIITRKILEDAAAKSGAANDPKVISQLAKVKAGLMIQSYLSNVIEKEISEDKIQKIYNEVMEKQPKQEEVKASHILLKDEKKAKEIIEELEKGADFAKLATESSDGPSAKNGGDLGYFNKETMVPEFAEVAFKLNVGEISKKPVKTQFGWHVIKVTDKRIKPPPALDEVREQIKQIVGSSIAEAKVADLKKSAKIKMFDLDGKEIDPNAEMTPATPPSQDKATAVSIPDAAETGDSASSAPETGAAPSAPETGESSPSAK